MSHVSWPMRGQYPDLLIILDQSGTSTFTDNNIFPICDPELQGNIWRNTGGNEYLILFWAKYLACLPELGGVLLVQVQDVKVLKGGGTAAGALHLWSGPVATLLDQGINIFLKKEIF